MSVCKNCGKDTPNEYCSYCKGYNDMIGYAKSQLSKRKGMK